jgi:hypothetical protein
MFLMAGLLVLTACHQMFPGASRGLDRIGVSADKHGFVHTATGRAFHPWGNNYGNKGRLMEDFWASDWATVVRDFQEMKGMGANVVRVHLQFGQFMSGPDQPNARAMRRLGQLVRLAETTGLYLDLTGLGCYRHSEVPDWYDALPEAQRWDAQARFWEAVAAACADSPAIFCYDLINEPIVAGEKRQPRDWYTGAFGGYNFIQFINLDPVGRPREKTACQWIQTMVRAIHRRDTRHMITVGLLPWDKRWGELSGFQIKAVAPLLDFVSVHIYPEKGKVAEALAGLQKFVAGKPLVVEETFPLYCSPAELKEFLRASRPFATGWIGHYNGETISQLKTAALAGKDRAPSEWLEWLEVFTDMTPEMTREGK